MAITFDVLRYALAGCENYARQPVTGQLYKLCPYNRPALRSRSSLINMEIEVHL